MMKHVIGITGRMGTGKSHAVQLLQDFFAQDGEVLTTISLDTLRRDMLQHSSGHQALRRDIARRFNLQTSGTDDALDLLAVSTAVFANPTNTADFQAMIRAPLFTLVERALQAAQGFAVFEWARLVEDGYLPLVNQVILMSCDDETLTRRLAGGDLPAAQVKARLANQSSADVVAEALKKSDMPCAIFDTSHQPQTAEYKSLYQTLRGGARRHAA